MGLSKRELAILSEMERQLADDLTLRATFHSLMPRRNRSWLDWSRTGPAWTATLVAQALVVVICAWTSARGDVLLPAGALVLYPLALLPIVRWSKPRAHQLQALPPGTDPS